MPNLRACVFLLLLALLAWGGIASAEAQVDCRASQTCTQADAYAQAADYAARLEANGDRACWFGPSYDWAGRIGYYTIQAMSGFDERACGAHYWEVQNFSWWQECPTGTEWSDYSKKCVTPCSARQAITSGFTPPNGSIECSNGCDRVWFYNGDNTSTAMYTGGTCGDPYPPDVCVEMDGYYWHPTLHVCAPADPPDCPPGVPAKEGVCDKPKSCPPGMVEDATGGCKPERDTCPVGQVKGPDGSCQKGACPAGTAHGKDGTCKKDSDEDGTPDDEEEDGDGDGDGDPDYPDSPSKKSEFSGGDSCENPPVCSGDAIMCGQARIQWRIECNTRDRAQVSGGACDSPPVCAGACDAIEYAQLIQQWRTSCALMNIANGTGDIPGAGSQPDWTKTGNMTQNPGEGAGQGDTEVWDSRTVDGSSLNTSGWLGGGGSCPSFSFAAGGGEYSSAFLTHIVNPPPFWCDMVQWIYAMVLTFATVGGIYILAGRAS